MTCPFYNKKCILKAAANLPDFKNEHDCQSKIDDCSFFKKEKLKQITANTNIKIIIKQVSNVYLVKADAIVYPNNILLSIDDPLLNKMTNNEIQKKCDVLSKKTIKMGYPYGFDIPQNWHLKQKYFINAVVAGESRLVNENDISNAIKKTIIYADELGFEKLLFSPCDYGTHDISLTSMAQLSAIFSIAKTHQFKSLKSFYICMTDEESEQTFIEYYNRIFRSDNES